MTRPANILYLSADCLKSSATPIGGNRVSQTPFMDRLASEGIAFTQAYACNPICTPSRATVFTGVHPLVHQVTCHQHRAPLNLPQLSELLLAQGYYTGASGHYEANRDLSRGWVEQCDEAAPGPLRRSYLTWQGSGRRDIGWPSGSLPHGVEESQSQLITDRAIHMMDSITRVDSPFFLHVSYNDPHSPTFAPPPYDTMFDPATIDLPRWGSETERPAWHTEALKAFRTGEASPDDLRRLIAIHYGMLAHVDYQMQRSVEALAARGLLENTWVVCTSDHGAYLTEKGMFSHTESLYECLLHVPLIIRPPDNLQAPRGTRVDDLVELVDIFPTILGMAGAPIPDYTQGHDLIAWQRDAADQPLRDAVFAQVGDYHGRLGDTLPGGRPGCTRHPGMLHGARTADFAYTRDPDFGDEAYDLRRDPTELVNLLNPGCPPAPGEIDALRRQVDAWEAECIALRDQIGVIPGWRGFDPGWE